MRMTDFRQRVWTILVNNWSLKALAVLLAVLSFYAIRNAISFEVPYNVPVEVKVEKGIAVLEQNPRTVDVIFRGAQENLRHLDQHLIRAVVSAKLEGASSTVRLPLGPGDIEGAPGVRAIDLRPDFVMVALDREGAKTVPVLPPKVIGRPLAGDVTIEYEPRRVTIRGPERRLKDIDSVSTEPVDVDRRVESYTDEARVLAPGNGWVAEIEPRKVSVRVGIVTEFTTRELANRPVLAVTEPGAGVEVRFEPASVKVVLKGSAGDLANLSEDAVQAFVNCVGLEPAASYELPVQVHLPDGGTLRASVVPRSVKAVLRRR